MTELLVFTPVNVEYISNGLKDAVGSSIKATKFWQSLTQYPILFIRKGNFSEAQKLITILLHTCKNIDPDSYAKIHKGNPYYFLGIASYLMKDYETATFFMDAAATEDIKDEEDTQEGHRQSISFLILEGERGDQAAKELVKDAQARVERAISVYNSLPDRQDDTLMTIMTVREKFLQKAFTKDANPGWRTMVTAFISFFIEWDFRNELFDICSIEGTSEPFFLHLFKGCLLFESLLKGKASVQLRKKHLEDVLRVIYPDLGLNSSPQIHGASLIGIL